MRVFLLRMVAAKKFEEAAHRGVAGAGSYEFEGQMFGLRMVMPFCRRGMIAVTADRCGSAGRVIRPSLRRS